MHLGLWVPSTDRSTATKHSASLTKHLPVIVAAKARASGRDLLLADWLAECAEANSGKVRDRAPDRHSVHRTWASCMPRLTLVPRTRASCESSFVKCSNNPVMAMEVTSKTPRG